MVVHEFVAAAGKLEVLSHVGMDDYADRLNFLFSVCILMVFSAVTTVKTYFLNPIFCYMPNIVGSHEGQSAYVNNYCYTDGTYNVPLGEFNADVVDNGWIEKYKDKKIYYYQWLPFFLGVQGVMFCVPRLVWQMFANHRAGADLVQLVRVANEASRSDGEKREKLVRHVTRQLELWVYNTREVSKGHVKTIARRLYRYLGFLMPSKRLGTWLVFVYFFVKCLYVANLVFQLLTMSKVLQLESLNSSRRNASLVHLTATFGIGLLSELASGKDWQDTGLFPRRGSCAVRLTQTVGAQPLFAQCALPVNMIHEKIFIFLWFWYVLVLLLTLLSIALWSLRLLVGSRRSHLPKKYLYLAGILSRKNKDEKATVKAFVAKFLRHDGALVLHMLALNCGDLITTEICAELYRTYKELYQLQDMRGDPLLDSGDSASFGIAVNIGHSSVAMSPNGNTKQRRRRRSNSGCNGGGFSDEKRRSNLLFAEPSAPLVDPPPPGPPPQTTIFNLLAPESAPNTSM